MNTPAHLIFGAVAFSRPDSAKITMAAIVGALIPDFSLYFLVAWSRFVQGNSLNHIFDVQYFSPGWQQVFAIDNSFLVWGAVLLLGFVLRKPWLWVLGGAATLHLLLDFPLHHDDARMHFWPVTTWVFESPVSYWDGAHFGKLAAAALFVLCCLLVGLLIRRFQRNLMRAMFLGLLAGEGFFAWVWITQF